MTEACRGKLITQQHYPDDTNEPLFRTFFHPQKEKSLRKASRDSMRKKSEQVEWE